MTDKLLEANLKAAELLGKPSLMRVCQYCKMNDGPVNHLDTECVGCGKKADIQLMFSIANPSDRDAVVQMLGKEHCCIFYFAENKWAYAAFEHTKGIYDTYQDAVIAAVLAV